MSQTTTFGDRADLQDPVQTALSSMSESSRLVDAFAHALRNRMAAGVTTLEAVVSLAEADASLRVAAQGALERLRAADGLLRSLVSFARPPAFAPQRIVPDAVLKEVASVVDDRAIRQSVKLSVAAPTTALVLADRAELTRALLHLAGNALDAMPSTGTLVLAAATTEDGGAVDFTVTDTGAGIADANRTRIWEPFFTTRPAQAGLGLSYVARCARLHAGTTSFEPGPQGGCRFRLRLPSASEA